MNQPISAFRAQLSEEDAAYIAECQAHFAKLKVTLRFEHCSVDSVYCNIITDRGDVWGVAVGPTKREAIDTAISFIVANRIDGGAHIIQDNESWTPADRNRRIR